MQRNARAEKVSGKGPVNTAAQNIVSVIAAEVRDRAEPASCIVGEGNTASVHAEAVDSGGSRVFAHVGISGEYIELRGVLRAGRNAAQRTKTKQAHRSEEHTS